MARPPDERSAEEDSVEAEPSASRGSGTIVVAVLVALALAAGVTAWALRRNAPPLPLGPTPPSADEAVTE